MTRLALMLVMASCLSIVACRRAIRPQWTLITFLMGTTILPVTLHRWGTSTHVGIAGSAFEISSYTLCILTAALASATSARSASAIVRFLPLMAASTILAIFAWPHRPATWSGLLQFLTGILGWFVGAEIAKKVTICREPHFATIITGAVALQAVVALLQWGGLIGTLIVDERSILDGRMAGTFNHANNLGKAIFLLQSLLLALLDVGAASTRRIAGSGVLIGFVPLVLTGGRAVMAASLLQVLIWIMLKPRARALGTRLMLLLGLAAAGTTFLALYLPRIEEDVKGGARDRLMFVALEHVFDHPITGVGVNNYVEAIGRYDWLTASGWPVHNTAILACIELGFVAAAAFLLPLLWAVLKAIPRVKGQRQSGVGSRLLLSAAPGVSIMGWTGWGLLSFSILSLWLFSWGFLASWSTTTPQSAENSFELNTSDKGLERATP